jgi:hypothetical protein
VLRQTVEQASADGTFQTDLLMNELDVTLAELRLSLPQGSPERALADKAVRTFRSIQSAREAI